MTQTFEDLIDRFEVPGSSGPAELNRFLKLKSPSHGYQMRQAGYIPPKHWPVVLEEAERRGFSDVTLELLARLAIESKLRPTGTWSPSNIRPSARQTEAA